MEVAIPRIGVQCLVEVIVYLNIEHVFASRHVKGWLCSRNALDPHVKGGVSCLTDLIVLTSLDCIFEVDTT